MKIFIDSANIDEIKKVYDIGILDGVTTNPTLIAKENKNPKRLLEEICKIAQVPVNAEPVSTEYEKILEESKELAKISEWIVAKIPLTIDGVKAVKVLSKEGIKTTLTLVFTPLQALLSAKVGATYTCPFVGRLDDTGENGMNLVKDIVQIYKTYNFLTKVLVVSVRNINHVLLSCLYGADAVSIPLKVINELYQHPLTDVGIKKFLEDWSKIKK